MPDYIDAILQERLQTMGEFIAQCRKDKGLTQGELAQLLGMTRANVTNIETARITATLPVLAQIAALLDVSLAEIVISLELYPLSDAQRTALAAFSQAKASIEKNDARIAALSAQLREVTKTNRTLRARISRSAKAHTS